LGVRNPRKKQRKKEAFGALCGGKTLKKNFPSAMGSQPEIQGFSLTIIIIILPYWWPSYDKHSLSLSRVQAISRHNVIKYSTFTVLVVKAQFVVWLRHGMSTALNEALTRLQNNINIADEDCTLSGVAWARRRVENMAK